MAHNDREIERKYLLSGLPAAVVGARRLEVDQGYLPGTRIRERIRRTVEGSAVRYYRTIKMGAGLERIEIEEETTRVFFDTVWPLTLGKRVRKRRYLMPVADGVWEVDEFLDRDLVLAELELEHVNQHVELPDFIESVLVREVTAEKSYANFRLAR